MNIKVTFFDLETTSGNPVLAEILTGYFRTLSINFQEGTYEFIDELYVECKPIKYEIGAYAIHGISAERAAQFPDKRLGLRQICEYLKKHSETFFCCHANAYLFGKHGHYDWTVIKNDLVNISQEAANWFNNTFRDVKVISTHTIAKKFLGRIEDGLKLENLVKFYELGEYEKHNCKADVGVLIKIFMLLTTSMQIYNHEDLYDLGHYSGTRHWTRNGFLI